jgi:hypothetical protein
VGTVKRRTLRETTECPGDNIMRFMPTLARRAGLRRVARELERAEREQDGSACIETLGDPTPDRKLRLDKR